MSVELKVATLNVRTMTGKGGELAVMMQMFYEWKGSKGHSIGAGFKLFYHNAN